jgi:antitoxin component YwqK of YwqJK toxin-antitoxin module
MKKTINYSILLLLLLVFFGCGGPTIDMNSDDYAFIEFSKKGIKNYKGNPFSGKIVSYNENGELKMKETYKDGKKDGVWEWYYENGELSRLETHKDGKKDGVWEWYYENGLLEYKETYKDGKKDGVWEWYYENGQLSRLETHKDGKKDGVWDEYYENGQLAHKGNYKDGREYGVLEWYYENGQLKDKTTYKDGKLDGVWERYYKDGAILDADGKIEPVKLDGRLDYKETYEDGKFIGGETLETDGDKIIEHFTNKTEEQFTDDGGNTFHYSDGYEERQKMIDAKWSIPCFTYPVPCVAGTQERLFIKYNTPEKVKILGDYVFSQDWSNREEIRFEVGMWIEITRKTMNQ